jgi:two-component system response regulator NreC
MGFGGAGSTMSSPMPVRILLVDDKAMLLERLTGWLEVHPQLKVVGSAHSGPEALNQVAALNPDLVLMDVSMPDMNGFEVTRRIKSRPEAPRVILMSLQDINLLRSALASGADDYIPKANLYTELLSAIKAMFRERFEG